MSRVRSWFSSATPAGLLLLAVGVGVCGAFGAALFHLLIGISTTLFFGYNSEMSFIQHLESVPDWLRLLIPAAGGLIVGLIYHFVRVSEAEGEGVPEVVEALTERRGKIRPIVAPVKILTAAITLGSGGSAGREGPVIQIGSAIGSTIGQLAALAPEARSLLLAAGAAAAIGGTFGAPAAGVVFTVEILRERASFFGLLVISLAAVVGSVCTQLLTGYPGLRFELTGEVPLTLTTTLAAIILGACSALAAHLFGLSLTWSKWFFMRLTIPRFLKPALGGLFIGSIGLLVPYVHEPAAYPLMIDLIAITALPVSFLVTLLCIKMLATGITLGSGGSGGIFAPALLIGTILGSLAGSVMILLGVTPVGSVAIFSILGMAAVFAAAAHAPLTAVFILYEMTEEPLLVPLLMVTCFIAYFTARQLGSKSVYHTEN